MNAWMMLMCLCLDGWTFLRLFYHSFSAFSSAHSAAAMTLDLKKRFLARTSFRTTFLFRLQLLLLLEHVVDTETSVMRG